TISQHIGDEEYLSSNDNYLDDMIANDLSASDNIIDNEILPIEFIIEDNQSLNILESKKFQLFIASLDPNYKLLTNKFVKQMIYKAYNNSLDILIQKLNLAISCSLTCDLWTSYNRDGYLDITCHWIDNKFKLNEIVLGIYK
ncbi:13837_t:CDS:2, partial [Racocetra fulgida]